MTAEQFGHSVHMESFEEQAVSLAVSDDPEKFWLNRPKIILGVIAGFFMIAASVVLFLLMPYIAENRLIAELRERGAQIQTVSNHPKWFPVWRKTGRPDEGIFQTIWTANLNKINVSDADLAKILKSKRISSLWISSDQMTPEGLLTLKGLSNLKIITLSACEKIRLEDFNRFQQECPNVTATYYGNAFLGVAIGEYNIPNQVTWLRYPSPAVDSGVTYNDRLSKMNGIDVSTKKKLRTELNQYHPGDEVVIEFQRKVRNQATPRTIIKTMTLENRRDHLE